SAFESLKRDDHIRSTFDDLADPENWVCITDSGRRLLAEPDRLATDLADVKLPVASGSVLSLTLDTNCLINAFDPGAKTPTSRDALEAIFTHAFGGRVTISVTTRMEADLWQDRDAGRRGGMMEIIRTLPVLGTVAASPEVSSALKDELQR